MKFLKPTLLLLLLCPTFAWGYIDAGTGSFIFQLLMGAFFGILVTTKVFWNSIKAWFVKVKTKDEE